MSEYPPIGGGIPPRRHIRLRMYRIVLVLWAITLVLFSWLELYYNYYWYNQFEQVLGPIAWLMSAAAFYGVWILWIVFVVVTIAYIRNEIKRHIRKEVRRRRH